MLRGTLGKAHQNTDTGKNFLEKNSTSKPKNLQVGFHETKVIGTEHSTKTVYRVGEDL